MCLCVYSAVRLWLGACVYACVRDVCVREYLRACACARSYALKLVVTPGSVPRIFCAVIDCACVCVLQGGRSLLSSCLPSVPCMPSVCVRVLFCSSVM